MRPICPYCEQDYISEICIQDISPNVYMCGECDTVWISLDDVAKNKCSNFKKFMLEHDKIADWKKIKFLDRI